MLMDVLVKGIEFQGLDSDRLMKFLSKNQKTQIVDGKCFFGKKHVIHSIFQTLKAFRSEENIAKNEELEFLVRFSGERQIKNALTRCKPTKKSVFISWSDSREKIFSSFKKEFKFKLRDLIEPSEEKQKDAIERTATFYLSS
jgi:tRNA threonylcarbamoyladenosine modification (KEOPS) complex Cgi121 subunit